MPRVEVCDGARANIRRELANHDGREQGGALIGRITDDRIVIEHAGGIGTGMTTPRGDSWFKAPLARYYDLAAAYGADLAGDWHSHRFSTVASTDDKRCWEAVRAAINARVYVGLIVAPRRTVALALSYAHDEVVWSWDNPHVGVYLVNENRCDSVEIETSKARAAWRLG